MTIFNASSSEQTLVDRFFIAIEENDMDAVEAIYSPDALIWHNYDPIEARTDKSLSQSVADNLKLLGALPRLIIDIHYNVWYQEKTGHGFIRQHIVQGTTPDGERVCIPVCVVIEVEAGRIAKLYEYLDSSHLPQSITDYFAEQQK